MITTCVGSLKNMSLPIKSWDDIPQYKKMDELPVHVEEHFRKLRETKVAKYNHDKMAQFDSDIKLYKKKYQDKTRGLFLDFRTALTNEKESFKFPATPNSDAVQKYTAKELFYVQMAIDDFHKNVKAKGYPCMRRRLQSNIACVYGDEVYDVTLV